MQETLLRSDEWDKALYDYGPSMYFVVDVEGTVLSVNNSGAERQGYTLEELVGTVRNALEGALVVVGFSWFETSLLPGRHPQRVGRARGQPPVEGGDTA